MAKPLIGPQAHVLYRQATVADVPAMAESRRADSAAGVADERMASYLEGKHHPQQALAPRVAYVAVDGDAVVGYIAGHLTRRYGCQGELQYLFVAPHHRRKGVAAQLLGRLAGWFREQRAHKICVNVEPDNVGARAFYTRHGARILNQYWCVWPDIRTVGDSAAEAGVR